jgi:hypothetical protein
VWHSRPAAPTPVSDFEKGIPSKNYKDYLTLEQRPVDLAVLYRDAYARHRYVVEIRLLDPYYPFLRGGA